MITKEIESARVEQDDVLEKFFEMAERGKIVPLTLEEMVNHRIEYMNACEKLYKAYWAAISDMNPPVQVIGL